MFIQYPFWTMLRNIRQFRSDPLEFLNELSMAGRVTKFHLLHMPFVLISDPELLQTVLTEAFKDYVKTPRAQRLTRMSIGEGILSTDQEPWIKHRQNARPVFQHQNQNAFFTLVQEETEAFINEINTNARHELFHLMLGGTLRIINKVIFGVNGRESVSTIIRCMDNLNASTFRKIVSPVLLPLSIPTKGNRQFVEDRKTLFTELDTLKSRATENGLIHQFAAKKSSPAFTEELISIITAGHETTACLLTWSMLELYRHPETLQEVREELDKLPASCDWDTMDKNTPLTQAVINEVLRLYPPIWLMARTAIRSHHLGLLNIYKGDNVLISPYVLHRLPGFWTQPAAFNPKRFVNKKVSDFPAFMPFSTGPRTCIGMHFSLMESLILLHKILTRFDLSMDTASKQLNPYVTLRPGSPIFITFKLAIREPAL